MEYRTIANSDAILLLERVNDASATLVYFDPPLGSINEESSRGSIQWLYLQATCHAKRILRDSGVLVWHTLPESASSVRQVLERVFGPSLFVNEVILKRRRRPRVTRTPTTDHTSLLSFSKTGNFCYNAPTRPISGRTLADENGAYRLVDITTPVNRPNLQFPWQNHVPEAGRSWRYPLGRLEALYAAGRIHISEVGVPREKVYLEENSQEELGSIWDDIDLPPPERVAAGTPDQQSLKLMGRIIASFTQPGDLVVDPFCGTGTTLIAAEQSARCWLGADTSLNACSQTVDRLGKLTDCEGTILPQENLVQNPPFRKTVDLVRDLLSQGGMGQANTYELIASSESKTLEFKQTLSTDIKTNQKQQYIETAALKTIAAFLNSDGGTLLVGVSDLHDPLGVDDEINLLYKGSADKFLLHFKNLVQTNIGAEFYPLLEYNLIPVNGKSVLRVDCKRSDSPCFIADDFYVRTNPATDKLAGHKLIQYVSTRFPKHGST